LSIWDKASIPTIAYENVLQSAERLIEKGKELQKYSLARRITKAFYEEENSFKELFDICSCKCVDKGFVDRGKCSVKISLLEWNFWIDQKTQWKRIRLCRCRSIIPIAKKNVKKRESGKA
jgi:hypothetical protein